MQEPSVGAACVVVAAGAGTRLAVGLPKAFVRVGGITLLDHAVSNIRASGAVSEIVLVVPADRVTEVRSASPGAVVVAGGGSRQASVEAGLRSLGGATDVVLVHDAARAFTPPSTFALVVDAVRSGDDVVVPALELHDTVRSVDAGTGASSLVDRATLRAVQTPQGFRRDVLVAAHAHAHAHASAGGSAPSTGDPATDDATLTERAGHRVALVAGSPEAFKVTRPLDLLLAEALLASEHGGPPRAGTRAGGEPA